RGGAADGQAGGEGARVRTARGGVAASPPAATRRSGRPPAGAPATRAPRPRPGSRLPLTPPASQIRRAAVSRGPEVPVHHRVARSMRPEHKEVEAVRSGLEHPPGLGCEPDGVERAHVVDLIVDLDASAAGKDHEPPLGVIGVVADALATPGSAPLIAPAGRRRAEPPRSEAPPAHPAVAELRRQILDILEIDDRRPSSTGKEADPAQR